MLFTAYSQTFVKWLLSENSLKEVIIIEHDIGKKLKWKSYVHLLFGATQLDLVMHDPDFCSVPKWAPHDHKTALRLTKCSKVTV